MKNGTRAQNLRFCKFFGPNCPQTVTPQAFTIHLEILLIKMRSLSKKKKRTNVLDFGWPSGLRCYNWNQKVPGSIPTRRLPELTNSTLLQGFQ